MSLYGSGRREGIGSVVVLGAIVLAVLLLGSLQVYGKAIDLLGTATDAVMPALGAATCYRLLRAQRRSRYVAFLTAAGYAMSPWLLALSQAPREQFAAALAPLALEAVSRCSQPAQRRTWLPWTGMLLAVPFAAGLTTIGVLAALLCLGQLARLVAAGERSDATLPAVGVGAALLLAAIAATSLAVLDPLQPWLPPPVYGPLDVLHGHHAGSQGLDLTSVLRVPGPGLLFFALLGVLRRQRHASTPQWFAVALAGALPTAVVVLTPPGALGFAFWPEVQQLPATAWWLTLLGIAVLAAAGLDDFLDLPLRRRTALPWLLAVAALTAPLIPFASTAPSLEWPLGATLLLLGFLMPLWRRMGILQFKNLLAVAVVLVIAVPALQVLPVAGPPTFAAPLGEVARWAHAAAATRLDAPNWPYAGFAVVLLASGVWALSAFWRRSQQSPMPTRAKAAIVKKARPAQRS